MFKLTDQEIQNSIDAIEFHGYSALLPEPIEWETVISHRDEIVSYIKELDLDIYKPFKPLRVFAPKNRANIRVVHLLHPQDLIIYTALTLIVKDDIESGRISKRSKRVFSYRVDTSNEDRLYDYFTNKKLASFDRLCADKEWNLFEYCMKTNSQFVSLIKELKWE